MKDPEKGIGCTIKSAAGHIFVNRIIEDGPIAHTGVLRPGTLKDAWFSDPPTKFYCCSYAAFDARCPYSVLLL